MNQQPPPLDFQPLRRSHREGPGGEITEKLRAYVPQATTFGALVVEYASLGVGKGEQGKDNGGALVDWLTATPPEVTPAWCAGFASACYLLASWRTQSPPPFKSWYYNVDGTISPELWVPTLVKNASDANRFVSGRTGERRRIVPGSMMFAIGGDYGHYHVGIVASIEGDMISTIEGNIGARSSSTGLDMIGRLSRQVSTCDFGVVD